MNVAADRRVYWNRAPFLCRIERTIKIVVGTCTLLLCLAVAILTTGIGGGYAVASPMIPGIMLWTTASKLTRHLPYFRPVPVWCAMICGGVACVLFVFGSFMSRPVLAVVLASTALLCGLVHAAARWLRSWKESLTRKRG